MKIVINKCYGGFSISNEAFERLIELGMSVGEEGDKSSKICKRGSPFRFLGNYYLNDVDRTDPLLVQVVEELRDKADGSYAKLSVIEIPDDVEYTIEEYDGIEWVAEVHRTWH